YLQSQFWDGREPSLESQSAQPFLNPVEMGLKDHQPILDIVRSDPDYVDAFKAVFGKTGDQVTMTEVKMAIATFERTIIAGDSPFDRYRYGGDTSAMSESAIRGLEVYLNDGRCVSCHSIEENHALFSDSRFHNLGVGFERIAADVEGMATAFSEAKTKGADVDIEVLTNKNTSELGRFAVTDEWRDMGGFKTPTLRNIDKTAPYMHDGSLKTLEEVVDFYNNGGRVKETDPTYPFQSGGIRPLDLSDQQKKDLVAFMKALTSPQFAN
ncbi:MAG: c-type cytochrome, partial [Rhodospirillales bacterium]|nr:c-type cytochrome [Rhodospirillales bacterium]